MFWKLTIYEFLSTGHQAFFLTTMPVNGNDHE